MSFAKLDALGRKLEALEHAQAILGADEATHMAVGGGEKRAEAMSVLAGMYHRQATAPEIDDWIAAAETESLNEDQAAALREFRRHHANLTCLPAEFVERQTTARMRSEQLWRDLRAKDDWASFLPALEGVVALVREEAQLRAEATGPRSLRRADGAIRSRQPRRRDHAGVRRPEELPQGFRARGAGRPAGSAWRGAAEAAVGRLSRSRSSASLASP